MKKILTNIVAAATILALGLSSCKSDDDNNDLGGQVVDNKELISESVPAEGWSGSQTSGVLKYSNGYEEDDISSYYAFQMKDGVCETAVYNLVMNNADQASYLAGMLNSGSWVNMGDEDDDEEDYYEAPAKSKAFSLSKSLRNFIKVRNSTRAAFSLPIPVQQNGRVVYIVLPNFKGVSGDALRQVVNFWNGSGYVTPDRVIFGKYQNGIYTCSNMYGMNINYMIETEYDAMGFCTRFKTTLTLPDENWAQFYYAAYEEQMWDFEQQFGKRPELKREGNTVSLDALIMADLNHDQIDSLVYSIDWMNNMPIMAQLFE